MAAISPTGLSRMARSGLSVDVEDYFQVSAFAPVIPRDDWETLPGRVAEATGRVLDLFARAGVSATFFTLGWVAERHPALIRRIVDEGHEVASHGYGHQRVCDQTPEEFRTDIRRTKALLEDTGGSEVLGFRAASFSMDGRTPWAHPILREEGYRYSSSIYPVRHDHYGMPGAPRFPHQPAGTDGVLEIPPTTVRAFGRNLPAAGGGYFRLLPYPIYRFALGRVTGREARPAVFYFHPWEIDPDQPRVEGLPARTRFRHYLNLGRMERRLERLLTDFSWDRIDRIFLPSAGDAARKTAI